MRTKNTNFSTSPKEIKKIIKIKGEVRGIVFQTDREYVRRKKGEKGIQQLQAETKKMGYPINYEETKISQWYPVGLRVISLLACQKAFGWKEKEIFEMGREAPKYSFLIKMFAKYVVSLKGIVNRVSKLWQRHYTVGELLSVEFNEKEKHTTLRLKNFKIHPILCDYLKGYFFAVGSLAERNIQLKETKCVFKGDAYHEFKFIWK